jgi:hypothetical protein
MFLADGAYRKSFEQIFEGNTLPDLPSFYINAPSRSDPSMAPKGCDSLTVLVPAGRLADDEDGAGAQDWDALVQRARAAVIARLAMPDLNITDIDAPGNLLNEVVYTPHTWEERYNCHKGAAFGLNHHFGQVGYLRPQCRHPSLPNIYFAGSSTHPGSGLPNVLVSSRLAATAICEDLGLPLPPHPTAHDPALISSRYAPIPAHDLYDTSPADGSGSLGGCGGAIFLVLVGLLCASALGAPVVPGQQAAAALDLISACQASAYELYEEARDHSQWYGFRLTVYTAPTAAAGEPQPFRPSEGRLSTVVHTLHRAAAGRS